MSTSTSSPEQETTPAGIDRPVSPIPRSPNSSRLLDLGERFGLIALLVAIVIGFSLAQPETFATAANWRTIISSQSVIIVLALALMVPLLSGNFDLSVESVAGLASMVAAGLMARDGLPLAVACVFVFGLGIVIGLANGLLVTKFGLNGLIATLGSATIIDGLVSWYSDNTSISSGISRGLVRFGTGTVLGVPSLAIVAALIAVVVGYVVTQTPFGRRLVSIGSSGPAAELVGIRVDRMVVTSYVVSGGMSGLAGVLLLAQQGSASPGSNGIAILLPALAAVYLGASTWTPGQFNVVGTVLGLILVAVTVSGLTLTGAASWVNSVCYGCALILAVGASAWFRKKRSGA
ncbi:D-allose transport system permease protein AlsC [Rhodococcus sp. T7]|nr:D-allose transport system permease protein AlsC [Rhodococcus sp. T7]